MLLRRQTNTIDWIVNADSESFQNFAGRICSAIDLRYNVMRLIALTKQPKCGKETP
jgi:hypothetical protein